MLLAKPLAVPSIWDERWVAKGICCRFLCSVCASPDPSKTYFKIPFTKGSGDWVVEALPIPASRVLAMDGLEKWHAVQLGCQNGHESCGQFNLKSSCHTCQCLSMPWRDAPDPVHTHKAHPHQAFLDWYVTAERVRWLWITFFHQHL